VSRLLSWVFGVTMNEREWDSSTDPLRLLRSVRRGRRRGPSERKLRLFACACCRRVRGAVKGRWQREAVELAERYADGAADYLDLLAAQGRAWEAAGCESVDAVAIPAVLTASPDADDLWAVAGSVAALAKNPAAVAVAQAALVRELFGNPLRPVTVDPPWLTPTVRALAQAAYNDALRPSGHLDPARLAIVADALEEAGCTESGVLDHLHGCGPHVPGCWAVDLVLAKE
jgi:hypothetical protein